MIFGIIRFEGPGEFGPDKISFPYFFSFLEFSFLTVVSITEFLHGCYTYPSRLIMRNLHTYTGISIATTVSRSITFFLDQTVINLRAREIVLKTKLRWYRRRGSVGAVVVVKVELLPYGKPWTCPMQALKAAWAELLWWWRSVLSVTT